MAELKSEFLCEVSVDLEEPLDMGATPHGVLPEGGDWLLIRPDGAGELDVRATMRTDDGHIIYMYYRGILHGPPEVAARILRGESPDPSEYYFRTAPFFETGSEKYGWLNRTVAVGIGKIGPNWVGYRVHAIL
jgi:hypothetical protein